MYHIRNTCCTEASQYQTDARYIEREIDRDREIVSHTVIQSADDMFTYCLPSAQVNDTLHCEKSAAILAEGSQVINYNICYMYTIYSYIYLYSLTLFPGLMQC